MPQYTASHAEISSFQTTQNLCFLIPTKTLSYDSCDILQFITYCLNTCGPCNNWHYLGHVKNVYDDDDDDDDDEWKVAIPRLR